MSIVYVCMAHAHALDVCRQTRSCSWHLTYIAMDSKADILSLLHGWTPWPRACPKQLTQSPYVFGQKAPIISCKAASITQTLQGSVRCSPGAHQCHAHAVSYEAYFAGQSCYECIVCSCSLACVCCCCCPAVRLASYLQQKQSEFCSLHRHDDNTHIMCICASLLDAMTSSLLTKELLASPASIKVHAGQEWRQLDVEAQHAYILATKNPPGTLMTFIRSAETFEVRLSNINLSCQQRLSISQGLICVRSTVIIDMICHQCSWCLANADP